MHDKNGLGVPEKSLRRNVMNGELFDRLPSKLTISFPLWLIYGTKGEYSPYYDIDRVVREHVERGFNCIRIDSGAGLIHDLNGNLRPPFDIGDMFGEYEKIPRQQHIIGEGGKCDLLARLIETFKACKKYGVYVILSQWYYLHTYWFHKEGDNVCKEMFAIPPKERFDAFRKFWHYILLELEAKGLDSQIAFVEVFNEADDHPYLCGKQGWGSVRNVSAEDTAFYKKQHEEVIAWLREKHPGLLFAYDAATASFAKSNMPQNAQVYNFHSYYLWSLYDDAFEGHPKWFKGEITPETVASSRKGRLPADQGWYDRVAKYNDIKPSCIGDIEAEIGRTFSLNRDRYAKRREAALRAAIENSEGRMPIVCGEGVSYICSKHILWEEHSEEYWRFVKEGLELYKKAGVWGSVIRTCCGPEDPCWDLCADKLLELNRFFLAP